RTFGGITMNGCMAMNDAYGSDGDVMTDTWTIFGDPSLMVRTAIPATMTVTHNPTVFLGATSFEVQCDVEDALAVLSMNGEIVGSAYVVGGMANIVFPPLNVLDTMDLVVTAFNYFPYESTVEIIPDTGPYVVYATDTVNDNAGNANGLVDYNESILLGLGLTNTGSDDAIGVIASITTNSEFVSISDDNETYGDIFTEDTVSIADGYAFDVDENIPDGSIIGFTVTSMDESGRAIWESSFSLTAHAPVLSFVSFNVDDSSGNNNGLIDPGEKADISIKLTNGGSSQVFNVIGSLSTENEYITINNNDLSYGDLVGQDTVSAIFNITASEYAPEGTNVAFTISFTADYGISAENDFNIYLGQKPVLIMDFSRGVNSADAMMDCFIELNVGADIENNSMPPDLDVYKSIFVILGAYPDNHVLTNDEAGFLNTYLENGGRVYMEGGDTWAFDDQTSFHGKFMIDGYDDGLGDLNRINGSEGSMLKGFGFDFDGVNNYIDRLAPLEGAQVILQNENPEYATAISYEDETYKTIGSSADFGGLVDEEGSNKDVLMAEYLYFFGIDFVWASLNENTSADINVSIFPNPFDNDVEIRLATTIAQNAEISIYDLGGRKIKTLFKGKIQNGENGFVWDASKAKAGIYIYSVRTKDKNVVGKLMLTK
ncbi:MAG: T9SS type A sorting domain-containing protein, partial [Chlorobi bacterium]|nr:T9SS type A sorting domain-containing protein [Chlorobiota bacterium]